MRKENIAILILLFLSLFVESVSASCGPGEVEVEHYWYADHFDNAATFSDWVGDDPDKSNWYIQDAGPANSSLEANADNPSFYLMMDQTKYGTGNYSFRIKTWGYESAGMPGSIRTDYDEGFILDDMTGWGQYIEAYNTNNINPQIYYNELFSFSRELINADDIYITPLTEWNWVNFTYYEDAGDSKIDWYINNTLIGTGTDVGALYDPGYIFIVSCFNLIQYDYISFSNITCVAEGVPPPVTTTSIIDPNLVDWRNLSVMISNVPRIFPGILIMVLGILPLVLIGLVIGLVIGLFGEIIDIMKNLSQYFK